MDKIFNVRKASKQAVWNEEMRICAGTQVSVARILCGCCDPDLDPITFIYELQLRVESGYLYAAPNSLFSHNGAGRWFTNFTHAGTWPVLPGDMADGCANMNLLCQGFRKLSSDRQTYRQTESTEIIKHAASRVVNNGTYWKLQSRNNDYVGLIIATHTRLQKKNRHYATYMLWFSSF